MTFFDDIVEKAKVLEGKYKVDTDEAFRVFGDLMYNHGEIDENRGRLICRSLMLVIIDNCVREIRDNYIESMEAFVRDMDAIRPAKPNSAVIVFPGDLR